MGHELTLLEENCCKVIMMEDKLSCISLICFFRTSNSVTTISICLLMGHAKQEGEVVEDDGGLAGQGTDAELVGEGEAEEFWGEEDEDKVCCGCG